MFANFFAVLVKSSLLNIGLKLPLGFALRKTYIVAGHWSLATYLTFSHNLTLGEGFITLKGQKLLRKSLALTN